MMKNFDLQTILVLIGAVVLVLFPQIKAAYQQLTAPKPEDDMPDIPKDVEQDRSKADWIVLLSELQKQCNSCGFGQAEKLCCQLTTELVCNCNAPAPAQEVQVKVTKVMA